MQKLELLTKNINDVQSCTVKENPKISKYVVFEVSNFKNKKIVQPSCLQKVWKILLPEIRILIKSLEFKKNHAHLVDNFEAFMYDKSGLRKIGFIVKLDLD